MEAVHEGLTGAGLQRGNRGVRVRKGDCNPKLRFNELRVRSQAFQWPRGTMQAM